MEVHKHPHHVTHKKKWREYLLEFLMIFFAVFLGFLAENVRENIVDKHREKEYMKSMVRDLRMDTAMFSEGFVRKRTRIKAIDSIFSFFETHNQPSEISGYLFRILYRTGYDQIYERNAITINQLKNAGGMSFIKNVKIADSIAAYDLAWLHSDYFHQVYTSNQQIIFNYLGKIISDTTILKFYREDPIGSRSGLRLPDNLMIKINSTLLPEFLNFLFNQKATTIQDINAYQRLQTNAKRLINFINIEYGLESE